MDDLTDKELLEQYVNGSQRAFTELYHRHNDYILQVISREVKFETELHEDIASDVWMRVHRFHHKFKWDSSFRTWIYRIATNCSRSQLLKGRNCPVGKSPVSIEMLVEASNIHSDRRESDNGYTNSHADVLEANSEFDVEELEKFNKLEAKVLEKCNPEAVGSYRMYMNGATIGQVAESRGLHFRKAQSQIFRVRKQVLTTFKEARKYE